MNYKLNIQVHQLDYATLKMIKKEVDRNRAFQPSSSPFQSASDLKPKKVVSLNHEKSQSQITVSGGGGKSSGVRLHRPEPGMIVKVR